MVRTAAADTAPGPETPTSTSAPRSTSSAMPRSSAGVRPRGQRRALGVEAGAPRVERALEVADDHVLHAVGEDDLRARDPRGARADDHDLDLAGVLAHHAQRVDQRGEDDDRGAVLVVVEDRDVELGAQPALDLEAARRRDVLEVDPAEARRDRLDEGDDLVGVLGVQAQREGVDARELLEEHRLALHHRHRGRRPDVAQPQHRGAVGHDGDRVALDGQRPRLGGVVVDGGGHARHARRVGHREVVAGGDRDLRLDDDLAAAVHEEGAVRDALDRDALERLDRRHDGLAVGDVGARDGHVAHGAPVLDAHEVDRAEDRAGVADRAGHPGERPRGVGQLHADGDAVGGRGLRAGAHSAPRILGATCFLRLMTPGRSSAPSSRSCPKARSSGTGSPATSILVFLARMSVTMSAHRR